MLLVVDKFKILILELSKARPVSFTFPSPRTVEVPFKELDVLSISTNNDFISGELTEESGKVNITFNSAIAVDTYFNFEIIFDDGDFQVSTGDVEGQFVQEKLFLSAIINGSPWISKNVNAGMYSNDFDIGSGTQTYYYRFIEGSNYEVNDGDVAYLHFGLNYSQSSYDFVVGALSLNSDPYSFNSGLRIGYLGQKCEGMCHFGGGYIQQVDNVTLNINSIENGVIEGVFAFTISELNSETAKYSVIYTVTDGFFKISSGN